MNKVIKEYHDLVIKTEEKDLKKIAEELSQRLIEAKALYGGRLLSNYLRANFLKASVAEKYKKVCSVLRNCVSKVKEALLSNANLLDDIGLIEEEKNLIKIEPGISRISITARWDSFHKNGKIKFVELNAECPAGIAYCDVMSEIYNRLPFMKELQKKYKIKTFSVRPILLNALLEAYKEWKGNKKNKSTINIAIVDWKEVPTRYEFEIFCEYFKDNGYPAVIADPRDLEYRSKSLYYKDFQIDLVYRRVLTNEFIQKFDEVKPLFEAYRNRDVCVINSFRSKLAHKKSLFMIFTHEKYANWFTAEEKRIIKNHIPWTRKIQDSYTYYKDKKIDLIPWIMKNKNNLVIKPNDEYGGKGIIVGHLTEQQEWEKKINEALNNYFIVQERVEIPTEPFPIFRDKLEFDELIIDLDPFVFGAEIGGFLARLSASALANVTAGGGSVPTFIIEN